MSAPAEAIEVTCDTHRAAVVRPTLAYYRDLVLQRNVKVQSRLLIHERVWCSRLDRHGVMRIIGVRRLALYMLLGVGGSLRLRL